MIRDADSYDLTTTQLHFKLIQFWPKLCKTHATLKSLMLKQKTIFFIPTHACAISLSHSHTQRQPTTAQLLPSLPPASPRPAQPSLPFAQARVVIFGVVGCRGWLLWWVSAWLGRLVQWNSGQQCTNFLRNLI